MLDVACLADLEQRAGVEHIHPVADRECDAQVVGDEDHAHAARRLGPAEEVEDLGLGRDVERRRRLVGEEQLGISGQCGGEGNPLTHSTGQLEGVAIDHRGIVDAHLGQPSDGGRPTLRPRDPLTGLQS